MSWRTITEDWLRELRLKAVIPNDFQACCNITNFTVFLFVCFGKSLHLFPRIEVKDLKLFHNPFERGLVLLEAKSRQLIDAMPGCRWTFTAFCVLFKEPENVFFSNSKISLLCLVLTPFFHMSCLDH